MMRSETVGPVQAPGLHCAGIRLLIPALYKSFTYFLLSFFPYLFTFLKIGPFRFPAGGRKIKPSFIFVFIFLRLIVYVFNPFSSVFPI